MAVDPGVDRFNELVGALNYPMFVVTATDGTRRAGCLVRFASQCSVDPPRFMVWLAKHTYTYVVARRTGLLAVHVPGPKARKLAELFGTQTGFTDDKFSRCEWRAGPDGLPILTECPQWFIGQVVHRYDTGDHEGVLLEPLGAGDRSGLGQLDFQQVRDLGTN
jgi:flavin reductase (DIM6/NTAB) family NADH-FMN oxidoreductase RutF